MADRFMLMFNHVPSLLVFAVRRNPVGIKRR
jgi:hypothetical protein